MTARRFSRGVDPSTDFLKGPVMTHRFRIPSPGTGWLPRRLTMLVAAGALALGGLTATARPAQADADDILRFLAGALVIGAIVHAIDDNHTPRYYGNNVLPGSCLETIRINGRNIQSYNGRCLTRAGYDGLPNRCRHDFRVGGGRTRTGFIAECLYEHGYRAGSSGFSPAPPYYGNQPPYGHGRPPHGVRPPAYGHQPHDPREPFVSSRLPGHCAMHYRQQGQRIEGYWGNCLSSAGHRNLPRHCRVTSTSGDSIFNAQCLREAGYRR